MQKEEILLRSKDVAYILDCCPDDVVDLARRGVLNAEKKGRYWRFPYSAVMDYKRKQERKAKRQAQAKLKKAG